MALKPNGKQVTIAEQIIEDLASGLTFQFSLAGDGTTRMQVYGDLPLGNREFIFDKDGALGATGTALSGICRATWIEEITP